MDDDISNEDFIEGFRYILSDLDCEQYPVTCFLLSSLIDEVKNLDKEGEQLTAKHLALQLVPVIGRLEVIYGRKEL